MYTVNQFKSNRSVKRRRFLESSAAIGGTFFLTRSSVKAQETANTLNVAVIGTGTQGQALINDCVMIPGVQIKAICDIWETYNLNKTSRILTGFKHEHNTYIDYQDMLDKEKDLDAVIIATPDFCHAEQTEACLKAGLHVYCESMMSNTLEGARQMAKTAKDTGKLLQIGYQRRSNPYYQYSLAHVVYETKMLGQITAINGQWNRPVLTLRGSPRRFPVSDEVLKKYGYDSMEQFRNWQWYRGLGGGPLAELGSHQIDVFNWYMGSAPHSVLASAGTVYYDPQVFQWFDTAMGILEYPSAEQGMIRAFYQTINTNSNFGYFECFMGDQGTLYVSEVGGRNKVYREPTAPDWEKWVKLGILSSPNEQKKKEEEGKSEEGVLDVEETVIPPNYNIPVKFTDSVYKPHLENFFSAIQGKVKLTCPAEIAFQTTVTALKLMEAADQSTKIEFKAADFTI